VSKEQLVEAQARVAAAGFADRVSLLFCDYRDVVRRFGPAAFDAVVSCEMIEAVGHEHLPTYFEAVGASLAPGGRFAMQARAAVFCAALPDCVNRSSVTVHMLPPWL
jgi:cyclopropane-fatty-acyl-phospholipid synthase